MGKLFHGYVDSVRYLRETRPGLGLGLHPVHTLKRWVKIGHLSALVQTPGGEFVPIADALVRKIEPADRTHFQQEALDTIERPARKPRNDRGQSHAPRGQATRETGLDVTGYASIRFRRKHRSDRTLENMGGLIRLSGGVVDGWYEVGIAQSFGAGTMFDFQTFRNQLSQFVHRCNARDALRGFAFAPLLLCQGKSTIGRKDCSTLARDFQSHSGMFPLASEAFRDTYAKWSNVFAFAANGGAVVLS